MPEPQIDPYAPQARRVAMRTLIIGCVITAAKFGAYFLTDSVAVLGDALESIINIVAAGVVLYTLHLSSQPGDSEHPYGHGKAQILAVGIEGWLILFTAVFILTEAVGRLIWDNPVHVGDLALGSWLLVAIGAVNAGLAIYVLAAGRRYDSDALRADGKHLLTDVVSTLAVVLGLVLVQWTGWEWLDPLVAIVIAAVIMTVSWRLLWQSARGLMETTDPEDLERIRSILDDEVAKGTIRSYHKVRYRHTGTFHWVDMHLQLDGSMSVEQGHERASAIENRIEKALGEANATAHVEPWDPDLTIPPENVAPGALSSTDTASKHE